MPGVGIYAAATAFALAYNQSMEVYRRGAPLEVFAAELGSYYNASTFTGFWLGQSAPGVNASSLTQGILMSVSFLERSGFGHDLRMENLRIEPFSDQSAICWLTWQIQPKNGAGPWTWETVYGYRRNAEPLDQLLLQQENPIETTDCSASDAMGGRPEGWWEFTNTDNEVFTFAQRVPHYLDSYSGNHGS
ncbi:hypothetical protein GTA08_BOTSDO13732 [Botryosphaeria dothidea]|uniref:Uncharacterized protein n=1 Tax=Botryosphaeria dothidea TaxID=55169 RepID=A0A8H4J0Q6_9PEZI|nr:hypothetical protein GTA08_BOTSDO13732 [Botryosphaeria dothidea]